LTEQRWHQQSPQSKRKSALENQAVAEYADRGIDSHFQPSAKGKNSFTTRLFGIKRKNYLRQKIGFGKKN
jgi:hypothetical protein